MITSIPELITKHGSVAATIRETGISEMTVYKYRDDVNCERHVVYNNRLMTHASHSAVLYSRRGKTANDRALGL